MPVKVVATRYENEMKRALLVGIDRYRQGSPLKGCVNDVQALMPLLARNEDDSPNFACAIKTSTSDKPVSRNNLLEATDALLRPGADIALFYFAGHGQQIDKDVVLVAEDGKGA